MLTFECNAEAALQVAHKLRVLELTQPHQLQEQQQIYIGEEQGKCKWANIFLRQFSASFCKLLFIQ